MPNEPKKDENTEKPSTKEVGSKPESPKLPAELTAIKEKEKEKKEETTEKTSGIKRDMLETEVVGTDKETAEKIATLDLNKETAEQKDKWDRLELACYTLLPKLFDRGFKKEVLQVLESFQSISLPSEIQLNGAEKVALKKLTEIASQTSSPLFNDLKDKWSTVINRAHEAYKKAAEVRDYLEKPTTTKGGASAEKGPWLWEQMKEHPVISAICIGTVLYGGYNIFFADKGTATGQEQAGLLDKIGLGGWKSKLLMTVLGALALGGLIGYDKIADTLKKITSISFDSIEKAWEMIKNGHPIDALKALVAGGGTMLADGVEKAKEGIKWLDDQLKFTEMYERMKKFFTDRGIAMPDWIKNLSLSEIAKDLGITKENAGSFAEYAGIGGAALLLYNWVENKGLKKGIALNACVYLFIVKEGKNGLPGKILHGLMEQANKAKNAILGSLNSLPGFDALIDDEFASFKLEDKVDDALDWIKENPLASMAVMNGLWICRHVIGIVLKKIAAAGFDVLKYAWNNKAKAAGIAGAGTMLFLARREVVDDLIKLLYTNPGDKEALEMKKSFDKILGIDRNKAETLPQKLGTDVYETIIKDPITALSKLEVIESFKKGDFTLGVLKGGAMVLYTTGAPIVLTRLSWEFFKTNFAHIYSPEREGNVLVPMALTVGSAYVFGSTAWEGFRSYYTVFDSADSKGAGIWRLLKSMVPGSAEWRFVLKSTLSGPIVPLMRKWESIGINRAQEQLQEILELAKKQPPDFDKIRTISSKLSSGGIFEDFTAIKKNLTGTNFGYHTADKLKDINGTITSINEAAKKQKIKDITTLAEQAQLELEGIKTGTRGFLKRMQFLFQGNLKEAMSMKDAAEDIKLAKEEAAKSAKEVEGAKPIDMKSETFKNPDGTFKSIDEMNKDAGRLRKEIADLDDANPLKKAKTKELAAIEAFLDPNRITNLKVDSADLGKLDDIERAKRIESLAAELEAAEKGMQSRFNSEVANIIKEAKAAGVDLGDPTIVEKLEKLDQRITIPLGKNKQELYAALMKEYKQLKPSAKTPALVAQLRHTMEGADGSLMTRFVKGAKGRAKMMVLMGALIFATDQIIHRNDPDRELQQIVKDLGPELGQLLLDISPGFGTVSNYYSAFSGREYISKRDVSGTWDRVSNAIWGTVGLAGDTLAILSAVPSGSGSLAADVEIRLMKAAKTSGTARKLLKVWPKVARIAERMGGWKNFATKTAEYIKMDPGKLAKGLRGIEKIGMVAGTAMVIGGAAYHLRYAFVDNKTEIDIPSEIMGGRPLEEAKAPT